MYKQSLILTFAVFALSATSALAQTVVAECDGPNYMSTVGKATNDELVILYKLNRGPTADEKTLMRFETPSGAQVWDWTADTADTLKGHCQTQHYQKMKPLNGTWVMSTKDVQLEGCPDAADMVPPGMTGTRELSWQYLFSPSVFLKGSQIDFDLEKVHPHHWIAKADAMPGLPGTVNITYDFKVPNRKTIDIFGTVDLKIEAGSQTVICKGTVDMVATHQG